MYIFSIVIIEATKFEASWHGMGISRGVGIAGAAAGHDLTKCAARVSALIVAGTAKCQRQLMPEAIMQPASRAPCPRNLLRAGIASRRWHLQLLSWRSWQGGAAARLERAWCQLQHLIMRVTRRARSSRVGKFKACENRALERRAKYMARLSSAARGR